MTIDKCWAYKAPRTKAVNYAGGIQLHAAWLRPHAEFLLYFERSISMPHREMPDFAGDDDAEDAQPAHHARLINTRIYYISECWHNTLHTLLNNTQYNTASHDIAVADNAARR